MRSSSARLDRLGRDERAVIERGSVEGKVFHRGAVAELSTDDLRESVWNHLQTLVRKELIRPDRTRSARRGCVPLPAPADSRRRVRSDAEGASRRAARAICGLARADRPASREQRRDRRLPPRAGVPLSRRARSGRRRDAEGSRSAPENGWAAPPAGRCGDPTWRRRSGSASGRSPSSPRRTSCDPGLLSDLGHSFVERGDLDEARDSVRRRARRGEPDRRSRGGRADRGQEGGASRRCAAA